MAVENAERIAVLPEEDVLNVHLTSGKREVAREIWFR
jgi:hypothetical protein